MTQVQYLDMQGALTYAYCMEKETGEEWRVEKAPLATGGYKTLPEEEARYWEENPPKH